MHLINWLLKVLCLIELTKLLRLLHGHRLTIGLLLLQRLTIGLLLLHRLTILGKLRIGESGLGISWLREKRCCGIIVVVSAAAVRYFTAYFAAEANTTYDTADRDKSNHNIPDDGSYSTLVLSATDLVVSAFVWALAYGNHRHDSILVPTSGHSVIS